MTSKKTNEKNLRYKFSDGVGNGTRGDSMDTI